MLSSNSSSCNHNANYTPFSENDMTSFTTSKSVEDPNFLPGFPNSSNRFEYEDVCLQSFLDHFYQQKPADTAAVHAAVDAADPVRSRSSKRDRHSKINTARGPRDRRMRLSLDIARRFFDLQDLLGFDKASRTVDWLLRNSSSAIADLVMGVNVSESCTSEEYCCEAAVSSNTTTATAAAAKKVKKRGVRVHQKRATVGRESRRKARERARERTSQKRRLMRENTAAAAVSTATQQAQLFRDFPIYDATLPLEDLSSDISQPTTHELCPWSSFNFDVNNNIDAFLQLDDQIAEFQFNGKPWETYNSFNPTGSAGSF